MKPSPKRDDETQDAYVIRLIREEEREACAVIFDRDDWPTGRGDLKAMTIKPREVAATIRNRK